MAKKIKILQLAPRFCFPDDDGGKIGIANIFKEFFEQGADVTFFSFSKEKIPHSAIEQAEKYGEVIIYNHSTENTALRIIASFLKRKSIYISKHSGKQVKRAIHEILKRTEFDIIHVDHSCMAPLGIYARSIRKIPLGLRLHNIEWLIWKRYADNLPYWRPKRVYVKQQAEELKNAEKKLYPKMDVCFTVTGKDKERAAALAPDANVVVASAGVDTAEWMPDDSIARNRYEMILATNYHWIHNVDAVRWFIHNVLPIVRKKIPEAALTLIGKNAPGWMNDYKDKGVNLMGYVSKVQPYHNRANVYIAPLFVGSGIRIKILEAMAMGLPVVATPVSAEGIAATSGDGLYIAAEAEEFARNIMDLLSNYDNARSAGKAARQFVLKEYSWKKNVGIMLDEYNKLLDKY